MARRINIISDQALISILLVLFVLPQLLLVGDKIIEKTSFKMPVAIKRREASGRLIIDGVVRGTISGTVTGVMRATVEGSANLELVSGDLKEAESDEE